MEQICLPSLPPPLVLSLRNVSASLVWTKTLSFLVKLTGCSVFYNRRTIRWNDTSSELRIIACVHHPHDSPAPISLIDWTNQTKSAPSLVSTVQLIELACRASTLLIRNVSSRNIKYIGQLQTHSIDIATMFDSYVQETCGVTINTTTFDKMHEDVIVAAKIHHAALILLPFHLHQGINGAWEIVTDPSVRNVNESIMRTSPCTVGIVIDGGGLGANAKNISTFRVVVLFFGGPDDRECIALAGRMAGHPSIEICVVRFTTRNKKMNNDVQDKNEHRELQVDEECMHEFAQNSGHVGIVRCINNVVNNAEEILEVLKMILLEGNDLLIVGKGQGITEARLMGGMIEGAEFPEFGPIGNLLATTQFGTTSSLMVIKAPNEDIVS